MNQKNKNIKLTCNLTGQSSYISIEQYKNKVLLYGSEDELKRLYIIPKIVKEIKRGHNLESIAQLFGFTLDTNKQDYYIELVNFYKQEDTPIKSINTTNQASILKTDDCVKNFISRLAQVVNICES